MHPRLDLERRLLAEQGLQPFPPQQRNPHLVPLPVGKGGHHDLFPASEAQGPGDDERGELVVHRAVQVEPLEWAVVFLIAHISELLVVPGEPLRFPAAVALALHHFVAKGQAHGAAHRAAEGVIHRVDEPQGAIVLHVGRDGERIPSPGLALDRQVDVTDLHPAAPRDRVAQPLAAGKDARQRGLVHLVGPGFLDRGGTPWRQAEEQGQQ